MEAKCPGCAWHTGGPPALPPPAPREGGVWTWSGQPGPALGELGIRRETLSRGAGALTGVEGQTRVKSGPAPSLLGVLATTLTSLSLSLPGRKMGSGDDAMRPHPGM